MCVIVFELNMEGLVWCYIFFMGFIVFVEIVDVISLCVVEVGV